MPAVRVTGPTEAILLLHRTCCNFPSGIAESISLVLTAPTTEGAVGQAELGWFHAECVASDD